MTCKDLVKIKKKPANVKSYAIGRCSNKNSKQYQCIIFGFYSFRVKSGKQKGDLFLESWLICDHSKQKSGDSNLSFMNISSTETSTEQDSPILS